MRSWVWGNCKTNKLFHFDMARYFMRKEYPWMNNIHCFVFCWAPLPNVGTTTLCHFERQIFFLWAWNAIGGFLLPAERNPVLLFWCSVDTAAFKFGHYRMVVTNKPIRLRWPWMRFFYIFCEFLYWFLPTLTREVVSVIIGFLRLNPIFDLRKSILVWVLFGIYS